MPKAQLLETAAVLPIFPAFSCSRKSLPTVDSRDEQTRIRNFFRVETCEPRLLLSADLTPGAEQSLLRGLEDFQAVLDGANADASLGAILPAINRSVAEVIDLGDLVETIANATQGY